MKQNLVNRNVNQLGKYFNNFISFTTYECGWESVFCWASVCVYVGETVYFVEVTGQNLKASLTGKPEIYENQWKLKEEEQKSER